MVVERPRTVDDFISEAAIKHGVSATVMREVIKCESMYQNIQSLIPANGPNGREDSWGIVQIHLPSHPSVTRAEALNKEFAANFLAEKLSKNQGYLWTCHRNLYK